MAVRQHLWRWDLGTGIKGAVVRRTAPHQAEASGPLGGLDVRRLCRPAHGPVRGHEHGPVPLEARDKGRQQPGGLGHREPHGLAQGEVVLEGVASCAPASPPGHGSASARQAP